MQYCQHCEQWLDSNLFVTLPIGIAGVALGLALWTKLHPLVLLIGGAGIGVLYGLVMEGKTL